MIEIINEVSNAESDNQDLLRRSQQPPLPHRLTRTGKSDRYDIYPTFNIGSGKIFYGYESLAAWLLQYPLVIIEGFSGVWWNQVQAQLELSISKLGKTVKCIQMTRFLKPSAEIQELVAPFLGTRDAVWGTRTTLEISNFFQEERLKGYRPEGGCDCEVVLGPGAALLHPDAPVIYLDVPKNEIQYRMRAGSVTNLGVTESDEPAFMYKQYYFVDWVVLTAHRDQLTSRISIYGDVQWENMVNWIRTEDLRGALGALAKSVLRVRPWFEPGAWGGQWMKERFAGLNQDVVNYAWSFELIVPENGLVLQSDSFLLEIPFNLLMATHAREVLGRHVEYFGTEFPIRFDFLDTWEGGNLSIQCHPTLNYIRTHFGERITQDETYYILDSKPGAKVFLGFQQDVDPVGFREALERSKTMGEKIRITDYVQEFNANKHDLFLIPNSTVHSAGADNLVLEISSTPYIFTFKMYDWLRLDLNGEPRAINIEHAFNNLNFDRQGEQVTKELISKPVLIEQHKDAQVWHLPTHSEHFYDVHRLEFEEEITVYTQDSCHVLMLVEGQSVTVVSDRSSEDFQYAETFVIPAAVQRYRIINNGPGKARVIKAFIKNSIDNLK
ncbi:class I mannose-6-phosphate isomerase [Niabella yanshanensis]|uniref:Class I mannose-6-phosphate isomerase n=1 Tax=Niabella yanshanensis TaxID=577386 RepID=A0ABZ0W5Y2_9BACT|nr:class I mannose-6-phosphate isomerase [Niabella yanshanensis]WQD38678.1 class I mannose-6-phosphate isomerase [Niabella yanshanensis]